MRLQLKGRQVDITQPLQKLAQSRLAKIERRLNDALVSAHLVLSREKNRYVAELTVHAKGDHILHGIGNTAGWSTSLTAAVQKVIQQAEKVKGKWDARKRGSARPRVGANPRGARASRPGK
jgi:ribosomal subunit interface protein